MEQFYIWKQYVNLIKRKLKLEEQRNQERKFTRFLLKMSQCFAQ